MQQLSKTGDMLTRNLQNVSHPPLSIIESNLRATNVGMPWFTHTRRISSMRAGCKY